MRTNQELSKDSPTKDSSTPAVTTATFRPSSVGLLFFTLLIFGYILRPIDAQIQLTPSSTLKPSGFPPLQPEEKKEQNTAEDIYDRTASASASHRSRRKTRSYLHKRTSEKPTPLSPTASYLLQGLYLIGAAIICYLGFRTCADSINSLERIVAAPSELELQTQRRPNEEKDKKWRKESKRLQKRNRLIDSGLEKAKKKLEVLGKSVDPDVKRKISEIEQKIASGFYVDEGELSIKQLLEQVNKLEIQALQHKKNIESAFESYAVTLSSLEKLEKDCKQRRNDCVNYQDYLNNISKELEDLTELSESCKKLKANLTAKLIQNPYKINTRTDKNFIDFFEASRKLSEAITGILPQLQLLPKIAACHTQCHSLLQNLQGSPGEAKEEKARSQPPAGVEGETDIVSNWDKVLRQARLKKQGLSAAKLPAYVAKIDKAQNGLKELQKQIEELKKLGVELESPAVITEKRLSAINARIQHIKSFIAELSLQFQRLQQDLSKLKSSDSPGFWSEHAREGRSSLTLDTILSPQSANTSTKSAFFPTQPVLAGNKKFGTEDSEISNTIEGMIGSLQGGNTLSEQKGQKTDPLNLDDIVDMARSSLQYKSHITDDIALRFYGFVAVMLNGAKQILLVNTWPVNFTKDPAFKKIKEICRNLTENVGLLCDYNMEDVEAACREFIDMIANANKSPLWPGAFNTSGSKLLKQLMSNQDSDPREAPFVGGISSLPSSPTILMHKLALSYLKKTILPKLKLENESSILPHMGKG